MEKKMAFLSLRNDGEKEDGDDDIQVSYVSVSRSSKERVEGELFPDLIYSPIVDGSKIYVLDRSLKYPWNLAEIEDQFSSFGRSMVNVKFLEMDGDPTQKGTKRGKKVNQRERISIRISHTAEFDPPSGGTLLGVGLRVIARTMDDSPSGKDFFVGIIAEVAKSKNGNRFLIFFDNGHAEYCARENIRLVTHKDSFAARTKQVWLDVHPDNQSFIKKYVKQSPNNVMARLKVSHLITVEWNGHWWTARVESTDCSLATVQLIANDVKITLWRGSNRLHQIFKMLTTEEQNRIISPAVDTLGEYEGRVVNQKIPNTAQANLKKRFVRHECSSSCSDKVVVASDLLKTISPLLVPFCYGWCRKTKETEETDGTKTKSVYYEGPCGKKFTNRTEIQKFITATNSSIGIDSFTFSMAVDCFAEFQATLQGPPGSYFCEDISLGQEWSPLSKVNSLNLVQPTPVTYSATVVPYKDAFIDPDSGFLICCDCTDNCEKQETCACFRLTLESSPSSLTASSSSSIIGYKHRRLYEKVPSGIYECNEKCRCRKDTCINRVVQNGARWKMQIFNTTSKGYAVRTLHDIPKGSFVGTYTGELMSSDQSYDVASELGDEYVAALDYLEHAEQCKDGYEANVVEPASNSNRASEIPEELVKEFEDDMKGISRTRLYYGYGQSQNKIYTVDAKRIGNVGRYLNHSCNSNLLCQHVFVDTHDIRFPQIAFFANRSIKCGDELTWDYNYNIGCKDDYTVLCNCGGASCRKNLL